MEILIVSDPSDETSEPPEVEAIVEQINEYYRFLNR